MHFNRLFTKPGRPIADQISWKKVPAEIKGSGFHMAAIEVPSHWSETASNILAQKYFRKAGVPARLETMPETSESSVPVWLHPSRQINPERVDGAYATGSETSARQVFHRLAGHWTYVGWKHKYFSNEEDARVFYDEAYYMLAMQYAAPNSPQWFNAGLHWAYGIAGPDSGQWAVDYGKSAADHPIVFQPGNSYEFPQVHACYIQPVKDDLVSPGGIMDLAICEVRLFKQGSGTGTNFSAIRGKGEKLSGGGVSSGLMSFLEILDRSAGAIQSGGTTRRAAKLVCLDLDHPEIEDFIQWKVREERKALALYEGSRLLAARDGGPEYSIAWEGEAIRTVSGQNSNNSIRITDEFLAAVDADGDWNLTARTDGRVVKTLKARALWNSICEAAWQSADPGLQFHDIINVHHTCKIDGQINASNPCGEYNFLDSTACNLASLNLVKFLLPDHTFNIPAFKHATRLWTTVLDISVSMASFPSREIAEGSYNYRTLGLGYANAGGLLMRRGLPYDSEVGRNLIASITALMHGMSYCTSADLASELGAFPRHAANAAVMHEVIYKHNTTRWSYDYSGDIICEAKRLLGFATLKDSFRNAQVTLLAPTGTISLVMDCGDFTGIEPAFALRTHKHLAGGGSLSITVPAVSAALEYLGYPPHIRQLIEQYVAANGTVEGCPDIKPEHIPVFDCANPAPGHTRYIRPMAHVEMVAAIQPFLSGAVSKTINLPNTATIEDVSEVYRKAHSLGLKAVALYRDGSKLSQPLSAVDSSPSIVSTQEFANEIVEEEIRGVETNRILRSGREALLPRRKGYTQKFRVDGQSIYLRTGEYEDGRLGELFVTMSKEGSTARAFMEAFAKAASIALQYGVPLKVLVSAFTHIKFEPAGPVQGHDRIKTCSSPLDLIFRDLGLEYLGMDELAQIPAPAGVEQKFSNYPEDHKFTESPYVPSGQICSECGSEMRRAGTCLICPGCGNNTGCG